MSKEINIQGIDYKIEKAIFLMTCGRTGSKHTQRAYAASIRKLEVWTKTNKVKFLALDYAQADDFIYSLKQSGRANDSIRRDIAAVSGFYTYLERRFPTVKNPFKGSRAVPPEQAKKIPEIPTPEEVDLLILSVPPKDKALFSVMAMRGLRAGALPGLQLIGNRFITTSKGKQIQGLMPRDALDNIELAGLDMSRPFKDLTANAIEKRVRYFTGKLYKKGALNHQYSAHDLRHSFACILYQQTKDVKRVQMFLGHSNIATTDRYLKSLGFVEE
jgi:site-specific recombinase XerD